MNKANGITARRAGPNDVQRIAPLFDAYRGFYRQPSDLPLALRFLTARAERFESILFIAERGDEALGFVQVYPSFSSVRCAPTWVLNDLFVAPDARRFGVARALLQLVADDARKSGAAYIELATETSNATARALYEAEGYEREAGYEHYTLYLGAR
jgi:ribosomal protein S18 acetylase RimI-like enzyme